MSAPVGNQFALGNEGGRPTKLTPELIASIEQRAQDYIKWCERHPIVIEKKKTVTNDEGMTETVEREDRKRLPTLAGFAYSLGISRDTLYEWTKQDKEFSDAIAKLMTFMEDMKWQHGMAGSMNAAIARFGLSAVDKYADKTETDVTSGGQPIAVQLISFGEDDLINKKDVGYTNNPAQLEAGETSS